MTSDGLTKFGQVVKYFKGASVASNDDRLATQITKYADDKGLTIENISYTHDGGNTRALVIFRK
jgi:hypothetical protein